MAAPAEPVRAVGIDLGERRIGVAVSDRTGTLATPRETIERGGDPDTDRRAIVAAVQEAGAERLVVGLPLSMDGRHGRAARAARAEAEALAELLDPLGVRVELADERLSTVSAERALRDAGHSGRSRRKVVDRSAAAVILQSWLDAGGATRG
jgi:putative holliday junction resolvase